MVSIFTISEIQHSQLFLLLMLLITRTNVVTNLSWFLVINICCYFICLFFSPLCARCLLGSSPGATLYSWKGRVRRGKMPGGLLLSCWGPRDGEGEVQEPQSLGDSPELLGRPRRETQGGTHGRIQVPMCVLLLIIFWY